MSRIRLFAVIALILVVQVSFFTKLRIFGVHPDLFLPFALAVGITGGRNRGAIAGFVAGLMADAFLLSPLGLSALAFGIVAYAAGTFAEEASGAPWVTALIAGACGLVGYALFIAGVALVGNLSITFGHAIAVTLVEASVVVVVAPLFAWAMRDAWHAKVEAW